jgi:hypothetical protein
MVAAATVGVVPVVGWLGLALMGGLIVAAAVRLGWFERLGGILAGDGVYAREALARTGTAEGAAKVAACADLLAHDEEVRLIRWTPARTAHGSRVALGASPLAWYLWLPQPALLLRVPDALVAQVEYQDRGDGVVQMTCTSQAADEAVTITDGETVETAPDSLALAAQLLSGLVIVDPNARSAAAAADDSVHVVDEAADSFTTGSIPVGLAG